MHYPSVGRKKLIKLAANLALLKRDVDTLSAFDIVL